MSNGMLYKGNFCKGYPNGECVYTWPGGERYEFHHLHVPPLGYPGHSRALLGGRGTHTLPDGTCYKGWFHNGEYHGRGVLTKPDDTRYEGEFRDGKYHGRGVLTKPEDGTRCMGEFRDGEYLPRGS